MSRVVAYYRVSTEGQGRSGLGLEAQRRAVFALCEGRGWEVVAEHTEVESGKRSDRAELVKALRLAKLTGSVLVVAKLDRLSRSVAFLSTLQDSGARFIAADMPEATELTVHIMAAVAQAERKAIATRTREALTAAKARGTKLGNPNGAAALRRAGKGNEASVVAIKNNAGAFAEDLRDVLVDIRTGGANSYAQVAGELNRRHIRTARGGLWHPSSARNVIVRLGMG